MDRRWTKRMTLSKRHARRRQNSVKATKKSCDVLEKERGELTLLLPPIARTWTYHGARK